MTECVFRGLMRMVCIRADTLVEYRLPGDVELLNEGNERMVFVTSVGGKVSVSSDKRFGVLFLTVKRRFV